LPCVILEALCCGLPVVSSNVGGISEVVNESNGILVEKENVEQLAVAMCRLMDNYSHYNRDTIAMDAAQKFNYDTVAKQYLKVYTKTVSPIV
jgi:glycosyltransferase involved in cell wall biosynthesis